MSNPNDALRTLVAAVGLSGGVTGPTRSPSTVMPPTATYGAPRCRLGTRPLGSPVTPEEKKRRRKERKKSQRRNRKS